MCSLLFGRRAQCTAHPSGGRAQCTAHPAGYMFYTIHVKKCETCCMLSLWFLLSAEDVACFAAWPMLAMGCLSDTLPSVLDVSDSVSSLSVSHVAASKFSQPAFACSAAQWWRSNLICPALCLLLSTYYVSDHLAPSRLVCTCVCVPLHVPPFYFVLLF